MQIRLVKAHEWGQAADVLVHLRPDCPAPILTELREELVAGGYELLGLFDPDLRAVLGWRALRTLARGRLGRLEDLVVAPDHRGLGYGSILVESVERLARSRALRGLEVDVAGPDAGFFTALHGFTAEGPGRVTKVWTPTVRERETLRRTGGA